ncbi:hypothetical protein F7Y47_02915 [Vibrio sp. 1-2-3a]|nr:hypothetical protein [Vibrio sp. 2-1-2a]MDU9601388.1 hypothetical protein [Vibrio sp. 1-2-3a]
MRSIEHYLIKPNFDTGNRFYTYASTLCSVYVNVNLKSE